MPNSRPPTGARAGVAGGAAAPDRDTESPRPTEPGATGAGATTVRRSSTCRRVVERCVLAI